MFDHLDLGPTPAGESCEQLGPNYDSKRARAECRAFAAQLERVNGTPPDGCGFRVKSNPHDFGTYLSVVVAFDDENDAAVEYAYKAENTTPEEWDDEARKELAL
jgi:hypothetical protein